MAKKTTDELLNHNFDGIQEYDNQLPGWWKWLFILTTIFGVLYFLYYHVFGIGDSSKTEYLKEVNPNYSSVGEGSGMISAYHSPLLTREEFLTPRVKAELARISDASFEENLMRAMSKANPADLEKLKNNFPVVYKRFITGGGPAASTSAASQAPTITAPLKDAAALAEGKKIFETQCFTCHGKAGEGGIGPNMTDDYWIHGGTLPEVIRIIRSGVPAKGMITWEKTLTPDQINDVASYIFVKLQGTNPPNGKAPQGDKFVKPAETAAKK